MALTMEMPETMDDPEVDGTVDFECEELIEVPIRTVAKAECEVEVGSLGGKWYTGWRLLSHKKKNKGEIEAEHTLSTGRPSRPTRIEAIRDVLLEIADWATGKDNRISQDVLAYRDTDWHLAEQPDGPATSDDPETQEAIDELAGAGIGVGELVAPINESANGHANSQPTADDNAAKAEAEFKAKMHEAAEELAECVLHRMSTEAAYKSAKAEEKAAAETLRKLSDRGPERHPLFEAAAKEKAAPAEPAPVNTDETWKSVAIAELGLASGLTDKLIGAGIDTIGRLEQRRADISEGKEKWPKGVGAAAVTKIENAVLDWLAEHGPQVDANDATALTARSIYLIEQNMVGDPSEGAYTSGRTSAEAGEPITDCPYLTGDDQDQWLMGYRDAQDEAREVE